MLVLEPGAVLALEEGIVLHSLPDQGWYSAFSVVTGDQFKLNRTSYWVLEAIGDGVEWTRLRESFLDAFEVEPGRGETDLRGLVQSLHQEKIIRRQADGEEEQAQL